MTAEQLGVFTSMPAGVWNLRNFYFTHPADPARGLLAAGLCELVPDRDDNVTMSWSVVESYEQAREGDAGGDSVVVAEHFAAIIDGVSGKTRLTFAGMRADRFAATVVDEAIRLLNPRVGAADAMAEVGAHLQERTADLGLSTLASPPGAVLGVVSFARDELWIVGDICARIDDKTVPGHPPPTDAVLIALRSAYLQSLLVSGASADELAVDDPSQPLLQPLLEQQWVFSNHQTSPWSYGVLDGSLLPEQHLHVHDLTGARELALGTDGFSYVGATLADTLERHHEAVAADPLCVESNPQLRQCGPNGWDDTAYLRLSRLDLP